MIKNQEKQNREGLLRLMRENPGLPVIPMVDSEVVVDDCCRWWLGHWGSAEIDEYLITGEEVWIKSIDDGDEGILSAVLGYDEYEKMTDEEAANAYAKLDWTKAVIVWITDASEE